MTPQSTSRWLLLAAALIAGALPALWMSATAQAPATPQQRTQTQERTQSQQRLRLHGGGQGFLIDKHARAGVACASCHTVGLNTEPTPQTCLGCHGGSNAALAAATKALPNPHESHMGELPCGDCHHVHKASETKCNQCHTFDLKTP